MIEFEVLGGVRLRVDGAEVDLAPMPQRLLGLLLAKRGQSVKVDTMIDALWEHDPPRTARKTVRIYVYRLRALIGDESRIVRADSGYRLNLKPEELDAARFEQLTTQAAQARSRGDLEAALCLLDKALGLWRGPAFDGLDRVAEVSTLVSWLDERRLTAFEDRVDIELELGRHAEAIGPLTRAVAENPYRERLRGQLMRALHRSGRQAEALDAYRQVRQLLATEMGMEPHEELQAIHREVLGQVPTVGQVPRHLPHDVPDFVGRQQDLEWLDSMAGARGTPLVITAVAGAGGIGKTALVLHWAHRVAELFPDGQLYVNLRGYDSGSPLRPLDALAHLLRCLGVQRGQVPSEVEVASALYRSLLAERKMLVVLDNACSAEQVRPLLPGVAGCRVVVTSRDRLSGLVAGDGARRLTLGLLPDDNGLALMRRLLGGQRVDAEPEAAARVVALCAGLPLALRIAAAKLADWPAMSLAEYAGDLSDGNRLAALALGGDEERAVTVVIDRSHDSLPAAAQRALRLLGLVPGPEFTAEALAALAGTSVAEAASNLDALAAAHLVEPVAPRRFAFHDLVRDYARAKAVREDPAALRRLLEYLLEVAQAARTHLVSAEPGAVVQIRSFGEAMAWMEAERVNLRAAVSAAVAAGWTGLAFDLASQMVKFLDYAGHVSDKISMFETLAAAIEPMGENKVKYFVLNALGNAYQKAGRHREAISVLERAIDGREALGDRRNAAGSRHNLATVYRILGRLDEAVRLEEAALATVREVGCAELEALFLGTGLPLIYQKLGRWDDALGALTRAMALALQRGSPLETGRIAGNLGWLHLRLGQLAEARQQLAAGLEIGRKFGGREAVAHCELGLAVLHSRRGEHAAAIRLGTSAFEVLKTVLPSREAEWCNTLGEVAADAGSHARARTLFERAASLAAQQQERYEHARALAGLGRLLGSRSHLDAAIEQFEATAPHEAARLRAEL